VADDWVGIDFEEEHNKAEAMANMKSGASRLSPLKWPHESQVLGNTAVVTAVTRKSTYKQDSRQYVWTDVGSATAVAAFASQSVKAASNLVTCGSEPGRRWGRPVRAFALLTALQALHHFSCRRSSDGVGGRMTWPAQPANVRPGGQSDRITDGSCRSATSGHAIHARSLPDPPETFVTD